MSGKRNLGGLSAWWELGPIPNLSRLRPLLLGRPVAYRFVQRLGVGMIVRGRRGKGKVSVHAPVAATGTIAGVMDDAVDDCGQVPGYTNQQPARRQFRSTQVNLASRADRHCRGPLPAKGFQVALIAPPVYAAAAAGFSLAALPCGLRFCEQVQRIVDFPIRFAGYDRYRASHAVSGPAFVSGLSSATVIEHKLHPVLPSIRTDGAAWLDFDCPARREPAKTDTIAAVRTAERIVRWT